ncbi:MAG: bifunctional folylpolyglutamate synthase/dihydrofolate synthase [Bacteroidota bacterium]|nr:bifunctional folylpolyglutamate synthase/dihydrofolate synthase [Bacteroidota bacterium]
MNYQQTLEYLYKKLPLFSRLGADAIKADLTNTILLCEALDNPQNKVKTIHIAGTNGKGSVSHMLAAILQTAGYKTGLYTSPHLVDFRERIKINGEWCSEQFVVDFTQEIKPLIEEIEPSFFEITVAMAFDFFAKEKVDIAVIETGLGGRLDSTNVITPVVSVITNIGLDHTQILGATLQQIAVEKGGIIKPHVPVIVGEVLPETSPVFEQIAEEKAAPLIVAQHNSYVSEFQYQPHQLTVTVANKKTDNRETYWLDIPGVYQTKNILTVLEAARYLQSVGYAISLSQIKEALQHVKKLTGLHGRWELIHQKPNIITDVAHNANGMKQLAEQIELATYNSLHIIIGMVKDKDVAAALHYLPKTANYYFTKPQTPRAMSEQQIAEMGAAVGLHGKTFGNVNEALQTVISSAENDDLVLVCGSVFLIGEINL